MNIFDTISFDADLERENYLSAMELIDIMNEKKALDCSTIIDFLTAVKVFDLDMYRLERHDNTAVYNPIGHHGALPTYIETYSSAFKNFVDNHNYYQDYKDAQERIMDVYWERIDLLKIDAIVKNTSIITWGKKHVLKAFYLNIINKEPDVYSSLSKNTQQAITEFTQAALPSDQQISIAQQLADAQDTIKKLTFDNEVAQAENSPKNSNTYIPPLGTHQRLLITYELFTPDQIVCLLIDENPACISHDDEYHAHWDMVSNALDSGALVPFNDKQQMLAGQVKVWLARHNFIYKGFNDNLTDVTHSPNKENIAYQNRIAELEQQLADEKAADRFGMGSPTVEQGEPKTNEQIISDFREQITQLTAENNDLKEQLNKASTALADAPADDADLNPKTLSAITRLLNVLFHKAQLDITAHKGTTNKNIVNSSISLNAKITEKPVSHWIRQVQQLRIDTQDRNN